MTIIRMQLQMVSEFLRMHSKDDGKYQAYCFITEFNAFLNERASAGEQLPSLPDVPTDQISQNDGSERGRRKMASSNQPMFGL